MKFEVYPLHGILQVSFGATLDKVRKAIGVEFTSFNRSSTARHPADYFSTIGLFAYYSDEGLLEAFEFAVPAEVFFEGLDLLTLSLEKVVQFLTLNDPKVEIEKDGAVSRALGISVYAPKIKENKTTPIESVMLFPSGYLDAI